MAIVHINRTYAHYLLIENVLAQSTELPLDLQQRQKYEIIIVKLQSVYRGGSTDLDWIVSSCGNFPRLLFFAPRTKCTRLINADTIRCASGKIAKMLQSTCALMWAVEECRFIYGIYYLLESNGKWLPKSHKRFSPNHLSIRSLCPFLCFFFFFAVASVLVSNWFLNVQRCPDFRPHFESNESRTEWKPFNLRKMSENSTRKSCLEEAGSFFAR